MVSSKFTISMTGKSNFPYINIANDDSIARRTRSSIRNKNEVQLSFINPKRDLLSAVSYISKVVGWDTKYPNLYTKKAGNVRVSIPAAEIWAGRLAVVAYTVCSVAKLSGLI